MAEPVRRAFVCGHPVGHSRSPIIHRHWLRDIGIEGEYETLDVGPSAFPAFLEDLGGQDYVGGNVTVPHKRAAWEGVRHRDAAAEAIGAVNTLWFENGALCGSNTDAYGFAANLDEHAPEWRSGRTAAILGAGGAARAVLHALLEAGFAEIRIVNRTLERAVELARARDARASAFDWSGMDTALAGADLVINTTSLGMTGSPPLEIALDGVGRNAIVTDLVYAPLETSLLFKARTAGLKSVDGLGMLLHQAVPGFERWFGRRPCVTPELRALVIADLERVP